MRCETYFAQARVAPPHDVQFHDFAHSKHASRDRSPVGHYMLWLTHCVICLKLFSFSFENGCSEDTIQWHKFPSKATWTSSIALRGSITMPESFNGHSLIFPFKNSSYLCKWEWSNVEQVEIAKLCWQTEHRFTLVSFEILIVLPDFRSLRRSPSFDGRREIGSGAEKLSEPFHFRSDALRTDGTEQ